MKLENVKDQILSVKFFSKYKNLAPYIGENYIEHRILLVGESHFLQKKFTEQLTDSFYDGHLEDYSHDLAENIRNLSTISECSRKKKLHTMHRNLSKALSEVGLSYKDISYYNFFLKPAVFGKTINQTQRDVKEANSVFFEIVHELKPTVIIFVSRKAFHFCNQKVISSSVPHPTSSWWNRKSRANSDLSGKEKFKSILSKI